MNLYLWCKGTQKYSDYGIRKYKKNKRVGISGFFVVYRDDWGEIIISRYCEKV